MSRVRVLKRTARYVQVGLLKATGLLWLAKRRAAKQGVIVLTFHRVLDDAEFSNSSSLPGILVRRRTFEQFLSWAKQAFEILDLQQGIPDWDVNSRRPRLAITFDDGWLDNYVSVVPLATKLACPLTIFICSGITGVRFPFWPERVKYLVDKVSDLAVLYTGFVNLPSSCSRAQLTEAVIGSMKRMSQEERDDCIRILEAASSAVEPGGNEQPTNQTMTWDQLRELAKCGVTIGSHTVSHCILTRVPRDQVRDEVTRSRREIEAGLATRCTMLAYPNGDGDAQVAEIAEKAGYELAFANEPGCWNRSSDRLRIPRTNIWEGKLTGPTGRFSCMMAEYHLFWSLPKGKLQPERLEWQVHNGMHAATDV